MFVIEIDKSEKVVFEAVLLNAVNKYRRWLN